MNKTQAQAVTNPYADFPGIERMTQRDIAKYRMDDLWDPDTETYSIIVDTIAGQDTQEGQRDQIAGYFGYTFQRDEDYDPEDPEATQWDIEELEEHAGRVSDLLNEVKTLPGWFFYSWQDGEYVLCYMWDRPEDNAAEVAEEACSQQTFDRWNGGHTAPF